jgi:hypothetical protein
MRFCTAIAKPEADQELTELERIYCMRGLASCVQNGVLTLLRDVDTNDLGFACVGCAATPASDRRRIGCSISKRRRARVSDVRSVRD